MPDITRLGHVTNILSPYSLAKIAVFRKQYAIRIRDMYLVVQKLPDVANLIVEVGVHGNSLILRILTARHWVDVHVPAHLYRNVMNLNPIHPSHTNAKPAVMVRRYTPAAV